MHQVGLSSASSFTVKHPAPTSRWPLLPPVFPTESWLLRLFFVALFKSLKPWSLFFIPLFLFFLPFFLVMVPGEVFGFLSLFPSLFSPLCLCVSFPPLSYSSPLNKHLCRPSFPNHSLPPLKISSGWSFSCLGGRGGQLNLWSCKTALLSLHLSSKNRGTAGALEKISSK